MVFRAVYVPLFSLFLSVSSANAAVIQAIWTGKVQSAVDLSQSPSNDPSTLIGRSVTYTTVYDTTVGRLSSPSGQSISGGIYIGPDIFLSQRFMLGGQQLPVPFRGYYDFVTLATSGGVSEFRSESSVSEGRYPPEAFGKSIVARLLLGTAGAPASLDVPFAWNEADGGEATGTYLDSIFSFETQSYRKYVSLGLQWSSVEVSAVPGPASGLLLLSGLLIPLIASKLKRSRRRPDEVAGLG